MRGPVAVILRFSIHLPLCSTDFRQLHRSYEEIRLLRKHQVVVVSFSDPTAEAGLRTSLEVRMTNLPPPPSPILFCLRLDIARRILCHPRLTLTSLPSIPFP